MYLSLADFKKRVEFSLCSPAASSDQVRAFCERALAAQVGVVCLNPVNLPLAVKLLKGRGLLISGNVGFPFGSHPPRVKALEARLCLEAGADQIDMVANIGALRSGEDRVVVEDIRAVVEAAPDRLVKTIIETWMLTGEEKERACRLAEEAGAGMVKTSTGVRTQYLLELNPDPVGATPADIRLMRRVLKATTRIKASGGIYSLADALAMIRAGADQLGMSQGEKVIAEFERRFGQGLTLEPAGEGE